MKQAIDAHLGNVPSGRMVEKILWAQRRALFDAFVAFRQPAPDGKVLNVCMQTQPPFADSDYLSAWSDPNQRSRITLHEMKMPFRQTGPCRLPYADNSFDWAFCNEVIEHTGTSERQATLVAELYRIARRGVFLTTSNRRHPLEFKSGMPLLHRLPPSLWRGALRWTGKSEWAREGMLHLVDASDLYSFASRLPGAPWHDVGHKRVFGIKAHFFLMIRKQG